MKRGQSNGNAAGSGGGEHIFQEMALHPVVVGLQTQHDGWDAGGGEADQRQMDRLEGIGCRDEQKGDGQQRGVHRFHQEKGGGALDIIDSAAAFGNHFGQGFKIGFEKHQLGNVAGLSAESL